MCTEGIGPILTVARSDWEAPAPAKTVSHELGGGIFVCVCIFCGGFGTFGCLLSCVRCLVCVLVCYVVCALDVFCPKLFRVTVVSPAERGISCPLTL